MTCYVSSGTLNPTHSPPSFLPERDYRYVRVFAIANPSVVCNVRAPYSGGGGLKVLAIFLRQDRSLFAPGFNAHAGHHDYGNIERWRHLRIVHLTKALNIGHRRENEQLAILAD